MPRAKRFPPSLLRVLEDGPLDLVRLFLLQDDENFSSVEQVVTSVSDAYGNCDGDTARSELINAFQELQSEDTLPVETECERVLLLAEGKGPTSLDTVVKQRLSNEECEIVDGQLDDLARSLWVHANHREAFDDAVSFRKARTWRDAKLYSAFEVGSETNIEISAPDVPTIKLLDKIRDELQPAEKCGISVIDLPKAEDYPPSVMLIIRHARKKSSVAEHPEGGGRRLHYYLPQEQVILIYTPALQRIEVCGDRVKERVVVSESFAEIVLNQNLSDKPLTWASYDTSRFLGSLELPLPTIPGYSVERAAVTEIEVRLQKWSRRLRLSVPEEDDISDFAETFVGQSRTMRRALGVARVVIAVRYVKDGCSEPDVLEITISGRNRCDLSGNHSSELRSFGRRLLRDWKIMRPFRDLDKSEEQDFLSILAELHEADEKHVGAAYFQERRVDPERLVDAGLLALKEVEPGVLEDDSGIDCEHLPPGFLNRYSIRNDWLQEKLLGSIRGAMGTGAPRQLSPNLFSLGYCELGGRKVSCYLARGLADQRKYVDADMRLRALSDGGPGVVFTGGDPGWQFVAVNLIYPIGITSLLGTTSLPRDDNSPLRKSDVEHAFVSQRGLILGGTTLSLEENEDGTSGTLFVPGKPPLSLFSKHQVKCFRLLVAAKKKGLPSVLTGELLGSSGSTGLQQMFGPKRWQLAREYVEKPSHRWTALKSD